MEEQKPNIWGNSKRDGLSVGETPMIVAIGFSNVKAKEAAIVYEGTCPYCNQLHTADLREGKVKVPENCCRHFIGLMVEDTGGLIMSFRPLLP